MFEWCFHLILATHVVMVQALFTVACLPDWLVLVNKNMNATENIKNIYKYNFGLLTLWQQFREGSHIDVIVRFPQITAI